MWEEQHVNRFGWFVGQVGGCNGKGDRLIISDLGYQKGIEDQIRKAHAAGWKIEWYDHHKWTEEEMERVRPFVISLTVDTSVCATGVVCRAFAQGNPVATEVARVVCDYDLWKHEDSRSAVLGMVTSKREYLELVRNKLTEGIIIDDEISEIFAEIERLKAGGITEAEFNRGKEQVRASFLMAQESTASQMLVYGKQLLMLDELFDVGKKISEIDACRMEDIEVAIDESFHTEKMAAATVGKMKSKLKIR